LPSEKQTKFLILFTGNQMDKLRIGVYLDTGFSPTIGGAFSYSERLVKMINDHQFDDKLDIIFVSKNEMETSGFKKEFLQIPIKNLEKKSWTNKEKIVAKIFSKRFLKHFYVHQKINDKVKNKVDSSIAVFLSDNKIDLLYYITPNLDPFLYPFIMTHWDTGHKSMWVNQEVFSRTRFEIREHYHRITLQKAFAIFVESEQSKKELMYFESINKQRISILPLFPGKVIEMEVAIEEQDKILKKWNIDKNNFYFYPAQFWAFKNQFGLVHAFKTVLEKHPNFKLVLSGANHGNFEYIKQVVDKLGIADQVIFTGFISNEELFAFYKNAIAMVMPSLMGPTNMPLLEAYYLGCHVLCSNLEGHIEQMGARANYFDPTNHEEMAEKMLSVINKKTPEIILDKISIPEILNQNLLNLYNIRKTFDYKPLYLKF
jgi:glycosyltransferase involved in cell wall biosynthesis